MPSIDFYAECFVCEVGQVLTLHDVKHWPINMSPELKCGLCGGALRHLTYQQYDEAYGAE